MIRRLVAMLALVACHHDVQLGSAVDASIDAPADGNGNPFAAGSYAIAFLGPNIQMCDGTLTGMEAPFGALTQAQIGLVDGPVTFTTPTGTTLVITGAPIQSLGAPSIELAPSGPMAPPGFWDGIVNGDLSAGPLATTRAASDIAADSATANAATIEAQIDVLYMTSDGNGTCNVLFGVAFTHS